jgi:cell division protein DivIC
VDRSRGIDRCISLGDEMWLVQGELIKYMARRRRKKKLSPFTVFGVIALCCVLCGTFTYKTVTLKAESAKYSAQISELQKEKKKLKEQKAEIKDYESYVKTKEYTEEVARNKLGLVYPDEIIFEPDDK